ncbi:MAG: AAA family ATPase [Aestuariivirga sp.]
MTLAAQTATPNNALVSIVPRISVGIFCDNAQSAAVMQAAAADRRMAKAHVTVESSGVVGAIAAYAQEATPNVVIVESHGDCAQVMEELGRFAEVCQPNTKVIVIGHVNDIVLYRELMKNSVSDYIVAPFTTLQIIDSIAGIFSDPKAAPLGRIIAFVGTKGGVGSSTIAHNIAYAFSNNLDTETILTDLDLSFGTSALNFNHDGGGTFYEALSAPERVDTTLLDRLMSKLGNKLSLLNGPGTIERDMTFDSQAVDTVLEVVRKAAPLIVVDIPNAWAPWVKHTLLNADEVIITASPELPSLRNAKNLMDMLKAGRPNDSIPKLILNNVGVPKRPEISAADFSKALGIEASAVIPHDPQSFGQAQGNGQMIFEVAPKSKSAEILTQLSYELANISKPIAKSGKFDLSGFMQKLPLLKSKKEK